MGSDFAPCRHKLGLHDHHHHQRSSATSTATTSARSTATAPTTCASDGSVHRSLAHRERAAASAAAKGRSAREPNQGDRPSVGSSRGTPPRFYPRSRARVLDLAGTSRWVAHPHDDQVRAARVPRSGHPHRKRHLQRESIAHGASRPGVEKRHHVDVCVQDSRPCRRADIHDAQQQLREVRSPDRWWSRGSADRGRQGRDRAGEQSLRRMPPRQETRRSPSAVDRFESAPVPYIAEDQVRRATMSVSSALQRSVARALASAKVSPSFIGSRTSK